MRAPETSTIFVLQALYDISHMICLKIHRFHHEAGPKNINYSVLMWTDFGPWISVNSNISMKHFDWCKLEGFMKSTVVRTVNDLVNEFAESPNIF